MLKPGTKVIDPLNREVTVLQVLPDGWVVVRLAGSYGATVKYTASMLKPVER